MKLTQLKVEKFLLSHKKLNDKSVHKFAAKNKLTPDKVEEMIYKIAQRKVKK